MLCWSDCARAHSSGFHKQGPRLAARTARGRAVLAQEQAAADPGARGDEHDGHQLRKVRGVEGDRRQQALERGLARNRHNLLVEAEHDENEDVAGQELAVGCAGRKRDARAVHPARTANLGQRR